MNCVLGPIPFDGFSLRPSTATQNYCDSLPTFEDKIETLENLIFQNDETSVLNEISKNNFNPRPLRNSIPNFEVEKSM